jgi:predicted dienelactone hydrolase
VGALGTYAVGQLRLILVDQPRIGPDGSQVGPRRLPVLVRYPAAPGAARASARPAAGPFPLVVFAPGFLQCAGVYAHLLHAWTSAGYVVAAVTFPRTNCHLGAAADEDDLQNQPGDMAFVIRRLITLSRHPGGTLTGLVDSREIAVAGHSDGGDTVAALAANACCADHAVVAAVVLAGAEWPPLGGKYFGPGSPPALFVQGSADPINPPWASMQLYQADTAGIRYYLDVFGAGHLTPYEGDDRQERVVARVTTAFLDRYVAAQRSARATLVRRGNVPGVAALVSGGRLPPA